MKRYVLPLADPGATLDVAGGKGASLAKLANAGLPVPGGFHVTTAAYKQFVAANALQPRILAALETVDVDQPATLEAASRTIHALFLAGSVPPEISGAIRDAYVALSPKSETQNPTLPVAVRSSATAEDLPDLSFAGQQETFLNVQGPDAVLDAVKRCWASLWTARAIGYRVRNAIDQEIVSLAVVVQALVPADVAGIMFTANPLNGRRDQVVINAAWGLGEAVVGGLVTPDTFTVDKTGSTIVAREIADKQTMTVRIDGGTEERPVPAAQRHAPSLDDAQVAELAQLGTQIEALYGMPMDIEWGLTLPAPGGGGAEGGGTFAILQARPITALPEPELEPPSGWGPLAPKMVYMRNSVVELLPDPLSPLFATLGGRAINAGTLQLFAEIVGRDMLPDEMFTTINGYGYYKMQMTFKFWARALIRVWSFLPKMFQGEARWRDEARPRYVAVIEKWQSRPVTAYTSAELLEGAYQLAAEAVNIYNVYQSGVIGQATMAELFFTAFYEKLIRRKGDPPALALMLGGDSTPIRAEKALYDVARWCREHPGFAGYVLRTPAASLAEERHYDQPPAGIAVTVWREWQAQLRAYLSQFGHTIYNLDFARPLPADDPTPILETLKLYVAGRGTDPYARQQEQLEQRAAATQAITARLKGLRLKWFGKLLGWVHKYVPMREDTLSDVSLGYPLLRQLLHEVGRRLVRAGTLEQADDVYWLNEDEVKAAAAALDRGETPLSASETVRHRKAKWRAARRVTPPATLPERSGMSNYMEKLGPARMQQEDAGVIKGVGASPGQVTARACVLHGPEDFGRMQPGDVLVAAITTPAWTPLFAMAAGVVTDIGGPLSHGSIVAREYGIPAVLGAGVATKRIVDGQTITVDGDKGEVRLNVPGAPPSPGQEITIDEWKLPDPKGQYLRQSIVDLMPDPVRPLFRTLGLGTISAQMQRAMSTITRSNAVLPEAYFVTINDYVYQTGRMSAGMLWWTLTRMLPAFPRMMRDGVKIWREHARPPYVEAAQRWRAAPLDALSPPELLAAVHEITDAAMYSLTVQMTWMGACAGSELLFTRVYEKLVKRPGDPEAVTFLTGFDSVPIRAEKSLYDLAVWAREVAALSGYLRATSPAQIAGQLANGQVPENVDAGDWQTFAGRFDAHMREFGHVIYNLDFTQPLPLDDPAPMLGMLQMVLRGEGANPYERQSALEAARVQATGAVLSRVKGLKRWAFTKTLNWAQSLAELREDGLAGIGIGYPALRRVLRELGARFVAAGAIEQPDDIFWLEIAEIEQVVAVLARCATPDAMFARVQHRKAFWEAARRVTPPPVLPPKKRVMGIKTEGFIAETGDAAGDMLKGAGTSAGQVTAPARVLHGPQDFGTMQPGDVLVAGTTTPAWTPLFAMAAGVVTDIGGPLSHGSIVAREYGIPAVMGTGVATKRIENGQMITVDGSAGVVKLSG